MTLFFIGFGLLRLLGFAFLILLFIKIATIIRFKTHGTYHAISMAAERFADGKISEEQYREIKSVLKE